MSAPNIGGRELPRPAVRVDVEILISEPAWSQVLPDIERRCIAIVAAAAPYLDVAFPAEVSVLLCDDERSRALNGRFRGQDKPTNVLSFPADHPSVAEDDHEDPTPLGDIAIAFGVTRDEARAAGRPIADHLAHLLVHGLLHLRGHDHQHDDEAEAMEALERRILRTLAIDDPYR